jgi:cob(I)alamin adenosyltransferase
MNRLYFNLQRKHWNDLFNISRINSLILCQQINCKMKVYTKRQIKEPQHWRRVPKDHARIESYGTVDELNSHIGLIRDQEMAL